LTASLRRAARHPRRNQGTVGAQPLGQDPHPRKMFRQYFFIIAKNALNCNYFVASVGYGEGHFFARFRDVSSLCGPMV
jgi:hypothetical protein